MTFSYTKTTRRSYSEELDECFEDGYDIDYEVDNTRVRKVLAEFIYDDYFSSYAPKDPEAEKEFMKSVQDGITSMLLDDDAMEDGLKEDYYDSLKEYFEDEAI